MTPPTSTPMHDPPAGRQRWKTMVAIVLIVTGFFLLWHSRAELLPWLKVAAGLSDPEEQGADKAPRARLGRKPGSETKERTIEEMWADGDEVAAMGTAIEEDPSWLRRLLDEGADPNLKLVYKRGEKWMHPLELATRRGFDEPFEILLSAGSDPNGQSSGGFTALHAAARQGNLAYVERLLSAGANPNLFAESGKAPIEFAARLGNREILETLIEAGAEPRYALHSAANGGHVEIIQRLLDLGADPLARSPQGESPIDAAIAQGHEEVVEVLRAAGAKPSPKTESEESNS